MTAITVGSNGTLKSDNAENQLLELANFIKLQEQSLGSNPQTLNAVQITYNAQTLAASITYSLFAAPGINEVGQLLTTATTYLINTGFSSGDSGTFKSATPEAYFMELITYLQISENNSAKNPNLENNVSATYDSEDKVFSGNVTLPIEISIQSDGSVKIIAEEYLRD